jgi:hypothetical protein
MAAKNKTKKILGQNNLIDICSRLPELVTHLNNNNFKGGKGTSKVFSLQTPNWINQNCNDAAKSLVL